MAWQTQGQLQAVDPNAVHGAGINVVVSNQVPAQGTPSTTITFLVYP